MDTKSKNTKHYPLWIKALCVVLSALCCIGAAFCGLYIAMAAETMEFSPEQLTGTVPASFYDTALFCNVVQDDLRAIGDLATYPQQMERLSNMQSRRDAVVETQVQRYLREKAAIIRDEIYFVATHYDESEGDYYYEAYMRDFSTTVPQPTENTTAVHREADAGAVPSTAAPAQTPAAADDTTDALPKLTVDERAPYNVRYCQKLVNTVTGLDWLQYMSLVRGDAFTERSFSPVFDALGGVYQTFDYQFNETQIRGQLDEAFDVLWRMQKENLDASKTSAQERLSGTVNMTYRAVCADGSVIANMEDGDTPDTARSIVCKDGKATVRFADSPNRDTLAEMVQNVAVDQNGKPYTIALYFTEPIRSGDRYAEANARYEAVRRFPLTAVFGAGIACAVGMLSLLIVLLCLCGHKVGADGVTTAFIDRMPTDLHFVLTGAGGIALAALLYEAVDRTYGWLRGDSMQIAAVFVLLPGILCAGWLLCIEWLTSTVRIKKSGQSFFRRFFLWKAIRLAFRGICFVLRKIKKAVLYVLEKPKKIRYVFLLVTLLYTAVSFLWIGIVAGGMEEEGAAVFGFLLLTVGYVLFFLRYLRTLDTIIDLSSDRTKLPIPDTDRMPPALRTLADNMYVTSRELDEAVAQAVRNERTKAELITNVSHDLKTPLTSVISYVDLLKQCDITDETAKGYLDILDEKSANLKRLVEDLIEASKVSTGNVTLHCTALNLAELAMQAVVEATPELEARGLEVKFTQSETAPIIRADGSKTYRILENLLSNVKKYAADHSRVYIRVGEEDGWGVFEIKNISAEPLDVDPQELLERFVRGDRSRTKEGNGLGLSIAQQLCILQGGRLVIRIDGDLFKAAVYLPLHGAEEGNVPEG